jgi:hypothetical protein
MQFFPPKSGCFSRQNNAVFPVSFPASLPLHTSDTVVINEKIRQGGSLTSTGLKFFA